eukprot:TRINITY_DN27682_c0_g1_i1.p2 TRINITY_DN27682_c0_g1~~TRINITY_DN27682_c0_g1_i1.p2  ORF type:complete len:452 (+),score=37.59 TRINITY_DN27682_c0_g1_i1:58-1413(+)
MASPVTFTLALLCAFLALTSGTVINKSVKRVIDLSKSVARHTVTLELDCGGEDGFYFGIARVNASAIARVSAQRTGSSKQVEVRKSPKPPGILPPKEGAEFWRVQFKKEQTEVSITLKIVEVKAINSFPKAIQKQDEPFLVEYYGNQHFYSPYETKELTTTVKLPSHSKVEDYSHKKSGKLDGNELTYGPFTNIEPFSHKKFRVHFSTGATFQKATRAHRILQLSHWGGTLAVEEEYDFVNSATTFKGIYSRLDFEQRRPTTAITAISALIPKAAVDIYYRDTIGNISTSTVRVHSKSKLEVEMKPRYPLMGGWKANFYWGYNVPLSAVCKQLEGSDSWELTIPRAQNIRDIWVEQLEVDVRLPDGASIVSVSLGNKAIEDYELSYEAANLYLGGRPTVSTNSVNIVTPDADEELKIVYNLGTSNMVLQPLYLGAIFMSVFLFSLFYVRLK